MQRFFSPYQGVLYRERQKGEDLGSQDAWLAAGGSMDEWRQAQLQKMRGVTGNLQVQEGGYYKVGDRLVHAVRQLNPRFGTWDLMDSASGMPLPPDAVPTATPSSTSETDPTSYKEWERVKADNTAQGKPTPPYDQWLTLDANRKTPRPSTTNIQMPGADMTYRQAQIFNPIVQHYQQSAPVKAVSRMAPLAGAIERIEKDPSNAFTQLNEIYTFIQALDTYQSTVREGEIRLTQQTMSLAQRLKLRLQGITSAKMLSPEAARGIATEAKALMGDIRKSAVDSAAMYRSQASVNGMAPKWDEFMSGAGIDLSGGAGGGQGNAPTGPKVGDQRSGPNGLKLYFDGTGWTDEVILPNPPGAR